jgi:hypothetical protein
MRRLPSAFRFLSGGIFLALVAGSGAQAAKGWVTFDVPGSTSVTPTAMGDTNTISGFYADPDSTDGSFIRASNGTLSTFNLSNDGGSTKALKANPSGDIVGVVSDNAGSQAFLRTAADGQATLFGVAGAKFTEATAINGSDWVAGDYIDPSTSQQMAFIHRPNGKVETFASPDGMAITVNGINNQYITVGTYGTHGYFRDNQGNMTTMRITANYIVPVAINAGGAIAGYYGDNSGIHGFIRSAAGVVHGFNAPSSAHGTFVAGLNDNGIIVGYTKDAEDVPHGFALNTATSKDVALDAPQGVNGTEILAIEKSGKMTGIYFDENNTAYGFRALSTVTGF